MSLLYPKDTGGDQISLLQKSWALMSTCCNQIIEKVSANIVAELAVRCKMSAHNEEMVRQNISKMLCQLITESMRVCRKGKFAIIENDYLGSKCGIPSYSFTKVSSILAFSLVIFLVSFMSYLVIETLRVSFTAKKI